MNRRMVIGMRWVFCTTVLLCTTVACEDWAEVNGGPGNDAESVEVTVSLGFAPEESAEPISTRASETITPDGLYELNVFQFDQSDNQLDANGGISGKTFYKSGKTEAGSKLTFSLTRSDDCQLVIIACGEGAASSNIGDKNLSGLQAVSFNRDVIDGIPTSGATQAQMNKMPYVLHLKHVKVTQDGKLQSPDIESANGPQDVRLLLKRLAAKVTATWNYNVSVGGDHYTLKQLLLQDVPLNFNYLPKPDADGVYPDIMEQYTTLGVKDYDLSAHQTDGTYSFWAPANVRKDNPAVSSDQLRIKANASAGSSYLTFVGVNDNDVKKKFNYRIYVGNDDPSNFSIKSNRDYIYDVRFTHTVIPASDRRVTYIDPIPASENNDNFVPTANCFMVAPGGAFCFDPFMFRRVESTVIGDIPNSTLKGWAGSARGGIKSVKLVWQTKENGDVGEPVMGTVNKENDHTNIVDIKRVDNPLLSITENPVTDVDQCRIYCRVASNTSGGNGLIAAYDAAGDILWSWHIWVTDYNPDLAGDVTVESPANKRKLKFTNRADIQQFPMMDRYIGAKMGYEVAPTEEIERAKANGLHYQGGRKDPFPGSYTNKRQENWPIYSDRPSPGLANLYQPDGFTFLERKTIAEKTTVETAAKTPIITYRLEHNGAWCSEDASWGGSVKSLYDPCPQGWRTPEPKNYYSLFTGNYGGSGASSQASLNSTDKSRDNGGATVRYDGEKTTYFRYTGYQKDVDNFKHVGQRVYLWCRNNGYVLAIGDGSETNVSGSNWWPSDPHPVRCIQEKAD